jgi:methyl-accepting chemotaxis protein
MVGDHALNGDFDGVDRVKALVGGTATVFMGDTRITTNVTKPDGSRAVGTPLAKGKVHDAVLGRGEPYRGEAKILGRPFFVAYDPIKDASGQVIGILYVGVPQADFFQPVYKQLGFLAAACLLLERPARRPRC